MELVILHHLPEETVVLVEVRLIPLQLGGNAVAGQGHNGGRSSGSVAHGGGGGAGGPGGDASGGTGGDGGLGVNYSGVFGIYMEIQDGSHLVEVEVGVDIIIVWNRVQRWRSDGGTHGDGTVVNQCPVQEEVAGVLDIIVITHRAHRW